MFRAARQSVRNLSKVTEQIYLHPGNNISFGKSDNSLKIGSFRSADISKDNFVPNPEFLPKLNELVSEKVYDDFAFIMEASVNANLFMPIYDFRDIPRYGRIPEIDNVYGYLQVDANGQMIPKTYQSNNIYQIYNTYGLITLSDYLLEEIRKL